MVERHFGLWVWIGEAGRADPALLPDLSFIDDAPSVSRIFGYLPTRANYLLLSDNILDLSHADYLHPTTLGGIITGSKMTVEEKNGSVLVNWWSANVDPPPAYFGRVPPGARADICTEVLWSAPAVMVLRTGAVPTSAPGRARILTLRCKTRHRKPRRPATISIALPTSSSSSRSLPNS